MCVCVYTYAYTYAYTHTHTHTHTHMDSDPEVLRDFAMLRDIDREQRLEPLRRLALFLVTSGLGRRA